MLPFPTGDLLLVDGRRLRRADGIEEAQMLAKMKTYDSCEHDEVRVWHGQRRLLVLSTHTWITDFGGRKPHIAASYESSSLKKDGGRLRPIDADMLALADAFFPGKHAVVEPPDVYCRAVRQLVECPATASVELAVRSERARRN